MFPFGSRQVVAGWRKLVKGFNMEEKRVCARLLVSMLCAYLGR